jgi:hypothetical protein
MSSTERKSSTEEQAPVTDKTPLQSSKAKSSDADEQEPLAVKADNITADEAKADEVKADEVKLDKDEAAELKPEAIEAETEAETSSTPEVSPNTTKSEDIQPELNPPKSAEPKSAEPESAKLPTGNASEPKAVSTSPSTDSATNSATEPSSSAESSSTDESTSSSTGVSPSETTANEQDAAQHLASRLQPIPPASEPMQYRAIGLVRGKYEASDEQFTRGMVLTDDGFSIGAVLLGRVMSLVKKHLDLEQPHLWVVYPRTREKGDSDLHVQIVGVWEPEKLNRADNELSEQDEAELDAMADLDAEADAQTDVEETEGLASDRENSPETESPETESPETESIASSSASTEQATIAPTPSATDTTSEHQSSTDDLDDKYFSVRGEVIYQSIEEEKILVKIRRIPKPGTEPKAFKVALKGTLEGKAVGYFWDLNVQREGNELVVRDGTMIGAVPPQKRGKGSGRPRSGMGGPRRRPQGGPPPGRKRWNSPRDAQRDGQRDGQRQPSRSGDRPSSTNRGPVPKPVIKRRSNPEDQEG